MLNQHPPGISGRFTTEHYQADLDITTKLAAADPTNTQWQRDLSISHERLGELAQARADLTGAAEHYQACLDITTKLAAADPTNTQWQDLDRAAQQKLDETRAPQ